MNKLADKYSTLTFELKDSNDIEFNEEIMSIREKGEVEVIPALVEFVVDETNDSHRRNKIVELIADITNPSAREILINSINSYRGNSALSLLISSLWQSRLDFTQWLNLFVEIMFEEDIATSIEAITLIENSVEKLTENQKKELRNLIRDKIISSNDNMRKYLILDLLNNII